MKKCAYYFKTVGTKMRYTVINKYESYYRPRRHALGLLTVLYVYAKRRTHGDGQRRLIHRKIKQTYNYTNVISTYFSAR